MIRSRQSCATAEQRDANCDFHIRWTMARAAAFAFLIPPGFRRPRPLAPRPGNRSAGTYRYLEWSIERRFVFRSLHNLRSLPSTTT